MTPNILKSHKDTSKFFPDTSSGADGNTHTNMDADHSAKALEQGANSAQSGGQDLTEGIHESVNQTPASGDKTTGQGTSIFSSQGAIGKQFTTGGAVGGTAQAVGGPFDKQGMIGKHFTEGGSVGGTFQDLAKKNEDH